MTKITNFDLLVARGSVWVLVEAILALINDFKTIKTNAVSGVSVQTSRNLKQCKIGTV